MQHCGKTIYASEKVRGAIRDHEESITPSGFVRPKAKVVVLGNSGVGKTSIIYRHRYGTKFTTVNATIGASFVSCEVETPEQSQVQLQVWDTAGQERFRCMVPIYMRNAAAALIIYDITCRNSFEDVDQWVRELERTCGTDEAKIYLIGNKMDLVEKRVISEAEGRAKAAKLNAKFFEVSSESPYLFNSVLEEVASDVLQRRDELKLETGGLQAEDELMKKKRIVLGGDEIGSIDEMQVIRSKFIKY